MRQVPYISENTKKISFCFKTFKNYSSVSKTFSHIAVILAIQYLMLPMLSFVFFSNNSPLWQQTTSHHTQSIYFGITTTAAVLGGFIAHTILNHLSDTYGRVFGLCCSYIGVLTGSGLATFALYQHTPWLFILAIFMMSSLQVSKSMGYAAIGDRKDPSTQFNNMAILQCVIAIGILCGSTISGHTALFIFHNPLYTTPYLLAFVFSICGLILCITKPPQQSLQSLHKPDYTKQQKYSIKTLIKQYTHIIKTQHVMTLLVILIFCQLSWSFYFEYMPPTLKILCHAKPTDISHFIIVVSLSLMFATTIFIQCLKKFFSITTIFKISLLMMISGLAITMIVLQQPQSHHFSTIYLAALLVTSGDVIIYTIIMNALASFIPSHAQGKLMGLDYIIITIVWSFIGILGGWLLAKNPHYPSYAFPIGIITLIIICFFYEKMTSGLEPENTRENLFNETTTKNEDEI